MYHIDAILYLKVQRTAQKVQKTQGGRPARKISRRKKGIMKKADGTSFGFYDMSENQKQQYYEAWMINLPDPKSSTEEEVYEFFTDSDLWSEDEEELYADFTDEDFRDLAKWVVHEIELRYGDEE